METGFLAAVRKGEPAALASGPSRAAVRRAETEHERKMDLAAAEAIEDWLWEVPKTVLRRGFEVLSNTVR